MEGSHSVSPGPAHQDDSWTCQRCGWVYPNAHPSAKHRRNHKKQCGKIKGFELPSELHKGGSSDETSSGDDSHTKKDTLHPPSATIEAGSAVLAVEHPKALESRNLLVTEANVPDRVNSDTPLLESISVPLDAKPEAIDHESTRDFIDIDTIKTKSPTPESKPNNVLVDPPLSMGISVPLDAQPEVNDHESKGDISKIDAVTIESSAPELQSNNVFMEKTSKTVGEGKDIECEEPPIEVATDEALTPVEEHGKPHASQVDRVEAVERGLHEFGSNQAKNVENKDEKSEYLSPKHTDTVVSMEEHSKTPQSESKMALTPSGDKVETHAQESQRLDSDHVTLKGRPLISKEEGLSRQGSSQGDDSWMCRRCGWVYPNPHPSAKHRKKHKKKCGKMKGFELRTELQEGSSDDVSSSDDDVHAKKEHTSEQVTKILQPQEPGKETGAPESVTSITNFPATNVEGDIIAASGSNNLQPKESNALKGDASDGQLRDTFDVKDISSPDVPVLPDNVSSLDQQNLPAAISHESLKGSEMKSNTTPCFPEKEESLAREVSGDKGKDSQHELPMEVAPVVANIPVISDLKSSDPSTPDIQSISDFTSSEPSLSEDKGGGVLKVDEPNAVVTSGMDQGGFAWSNETVDTSAGGLNQHVILKEERDISTKPGFSGLGTATDVTASDDTIAGNPLRNETGDSLTGGLDSQLETENKDLSSQTLPTDEVPVENKSGTENLFPLTAVSAAVVPGVAQDTERDGKLPGVEPSVLPVQLVPKNEPSAQVVEGGNDGTISSNVEKIDETSPVPEVDETSPVSSSEHPSDKQVASAVVSSLAKDSVDDGRFLSVEHSVNPVQLAPKNESSAQVVVGGNDDAYSSTVEKIDETHPVPKLEHSVEGQAPSVRVDVPQERTISAVTTEEGTLIQKSVDAFASKNVSSVSEDLGQVATGGDTQTTNTTSCIPEDTGGSDIAIDREPGGISSVKEDRQDKSEEGGAPPEATVKPEAKEETSTEPRGLGSSDLDNSETYSFTRSESGVTAPSELGGSSHKLSDSLEIYEDAQDTLETSSVGGSVDENEGLDEPRQASDRLQEEPEPLEAALSDVMVPEESVVLEQKPTVSNGLRSVESSSEEKAPTLPGTSYGGSEEKAPTLPGTSYAARMESGDLKAPSPEAWQETAGPSNTKSEGKKLSTSEVTEDSRYGESRMALGNLMAKEVPDKADPVVATSTAEEDVKSPMQKDGSSVTANGKKPKPRSFWRLCVCCSTVQ